MGAVKQKVYIRGVGGVGKYLLGKNLEGLTEKFGLDEVLSFTIMREGGGRGGSNIDDTNTLDLFLYDITSPESFDGTPNPNI